ncbi:uncharacterized protein LOC128216033 [Mya arenaria]|uniref:uncharacterized protein LOC128216033 n=1 Tax=Mya arenaria TaxID=6604 RepID=UPI0022E95B77|nr:uncharacterized protein LOC128216033 [Mya arenaria]
MADRYIAGANGYIASRHSDQARAFAAVECATTVTMPPTSTMDMPTTTMAMTAAPSAITSILYDTKHHKAIIVATDGCYEYHMTHQDMLDHAGNSAALEQRITEAFNSRTGAQEMGHNHINHMTSAIVNACAALPVYSLA